MSCPNWRDLKQPWCQVLHASESDRMWSRGRGVIYLVAIARLVQAGAAAGRRAGHCIAARPLVGVDGAGRRAGGSTPSATARACRASIKAFITDTM